jgi:hypothetical protein
LRDQPVLLNFWKSASTASMSELRHLQDVVARESGSQSPFVVAIGDGEGPDDVARMEFGRRGRIALVPEPDRQVARQYGVNCWPTTIAIDRRGRIEGGRFGMSSRRHRSRPAGGSAKPDITRP